MLHLGLLLDECLSMASADSTGGAPHAYARLRKAMAPDPSRWSHQPTLGSPVHHVESARARAEKGIVVAAAHQRRY